MTTQTDNTKFYQIRSINNGNILGGFWANNKESALVEFFDSMKLTEEEIEALSSKWGAVTTNLISAEDVYVVEG